MNSPPTFRWLFPFVLQASIIGCATPEVLGEVPSAKTEDEFWRTTYCVAGGLPMEVRFSLADNPIRLKSDSLDLKELDRLGVQVDTRLAALLRDAIAAAWQQTLGNQPDQWSSEWAHQLAEELVVEVAERAPRYLGISFCGSSEQVGNAALAAIFGYFSRSVQFEDGRWPIWLTDAQARSNAGITVMVAVALRLAEIQFDTEKLVQSLTE